MFSFKNDFDNRESHLKQQIVLKEKENDDLKNKFVEYERSVEDFKQKFIDDQAIHNVISSIIKMKIKN